MKKHSFKIIAKQLIGSVLVSVCMFLSASAAEMPLDSGYAEKAATVKYIGADKESFVFNVTYNNETGDRFVLRIVDANGNILYTGAYNEKKFDKRFRLMKDGTDKINFVIKNLKDNSTQTFAIQTTSQIVEDIVIRKVN